MLSLRVIIMADLRFDFVVTCELLEVNSRQAIKAKSSRQSGACNQDIISFLIYWTLLTEWMYHADMEGALIYWTKSLQKEKKWKTTVVSDLVHLFKDCAKPTFNLFTKAEM